MRYNLKGVISSDEDAPIYRFFGMAAVSPADIRQAIADNPAGEDFVLEINSGGGSVYAGFEMYSILRAAVEEGQLTEDTPAEELAELLMSRLYGMMIFWCMSDGRYVPSERTDALCDLELERLLAPYIRRSE